MSSEVLATCIIPTYGKSKVLSSLLNELEQQRENNPQLYEIIVVGDNISPPVSSTSAKCVRSKGMGGVSATRNYGAKLATSSWLIFLDDDVIPHSSWSNVLENFLRAPNCELAGGGLDIYPSDYQNLLPQKYRYLLGEKSGLNYHLRSFEYISGAHFLIKKSVYEDLGGFFETMGHKDNILCLNEDVMLQAAYRKKYGAQIIYLDQLRCNHHVRPAQTNPNYIINRLREQGRADSILDRTFYPGRLFLKYVYYFFFCLINCQSDDVLSVTVCDWHRRNFYLRNLDR
jgi:glycosyltransferase involved in cell wall biosynthesis